MCKKCEHAGISMKLEPLDVPTTKATVELPESWKKLITDGFPHQDLIDRAYLHLGWTIRSYEGHPEAEQKIRNARAFLSALAKGFMTPFTREKFQIDPNDVHFEMKNNFLTSIEELSNTFGNRISSVLWDSLAHLGTREDPEQSRSILKEADILPHHYSIVDTHLHALGKVYSLMTHIQSVVYAHTGRILNHNCDCDCSLINMIPVNGTISFALPRTSYMEATQSLFTHLCAESQLILNNMLPFEYSITKEAQILLGIKEN